MIPTYDNIPKDILDYINSHPAYGLLTTAKVDWDLWHAGFVDRIEPYKDFQRIFWGGGTGDTPVTKQLAEDFLKWTEKFYCEVHHVKTSGFFESQLPKVPKGILKLPTTLG
jgi:hypothetical protein